MELGDEVERVIAEVLENKSAGARGQVEVAYKGDEMDVADFEVTEYVNRRFPDEGALGGIDTVLRELAREEERLHEELRRTVREQASAGARAGRDIAAARGAMGDLAKKIDDIRREAEATEETVQEVSRDLKGLDTAKKNLKASIEALTRLNMLTTSTHQLSENARERRYEGTGQLLEAVAQLLTHFDLERYGDVPRVRRMHEEVSDARARLREFIAEDFEVLTEEGVAELMGEEVEAVGDESEEPEALKRLRQACEVVDALGGEVLTDRVRAFCRKQLRPYSSMFRGDEGMDLETIERRFAWFRRTLRDVESRFRQVFPKHWKVPHRLAVEFCGSVRTDVERILSSFDPPDSAPAEAVVRALQASVKFEREMSRRFEGDGKKGGGRRAEEDGGPTDGRRRIRRLVEVDGTIVGAGAGEEIYSEFNAKDGNEEDEAEEEEEEEDEEDEKLDEKAPLVNEEGEVVDPMSAEGIRLKYKRRQEFEARRAERVKARSERSARKQWLQSLGTGSRKVGAAARAGLRSLPPVPKLDGLVSTAFEPAMGAYVRLESQRLEESMRTARGEDDAALEEDLEFAKEHELPGTVPMDSGEGARELPSFPSTRALLVQLKGSFKRCAQLSTGQPLFELHRQARIALQRYASGLRERLPRPSGTAGPAGSLPGDTYIVGPNWLKTVIECCFVINSAEYCGQMAPQLADAVRKDLDDAFKEHVDLDEAEEECFALAASATQVLGTFVACTLDRDLAAMQKLDWWNVATVGDQSPYVTTISQGLSKAFVVSRCRLGPAVFRQLCHKFAKAFIPRYMSSVYRAGRIGTTGAQQLLLDAQGIRKILQDTPTTRTPTEEELELPPPQAPPVYITYVQSQLPRVDLLLKLLSTPSERFADSIRALWAEASANDLRRVMGLKGMRRQDQDEVLRRLGLHDHGGPTSTAAAALASARRE